MKSRSSPQTSLCPKSISSISSVLSKNVFMLWFPDWHTLYLNFRGKSLSSFQWINVKLKPKQFLCPLTKCTDTKKISEGGKLMQKSRLVVLIKGHGVGYCSQSQTKADTVWDTVNNRIRRACPCMLIALAHLYTFQLQYFL